MTRGLASVASTRDATHDARRGDAHRVGCDLTIGSKMRAFGRETATRARRVKDERYRREQREEDEGSGAGGVERGQRERERAVRTRERCMMDGWIVKIQRRTRARRD